MSRQATQRPFVHAFTSRGRRYIYDCNTNEVAAVGELPFELIPVYEARLARSALAPLEVKYGREAVARGLQRIREARKAGLFSSHRPRRRALPFTARGLARSIEHDIGSMVLGITEKCNLRCDYCTYSGRFTGRRRHSLRSMTWPVARKAIDYFAGHSTGHREPPALSFFGGEPLLEPALLKRCVEHFRRRTDGRCVVTISTNGTCLRPDVVEYLQRNHVYLFISLDGPREVHDAHRKYPGGVGSFARIMERLRLLREAAPSYWARCVTFLVTLVPPVDLVALDDFFQETGGRVRASFVETYGSDLDALRRDGVVGVEAMAERFRDACWDGAFDDPTAIADRYSFCQNLFSGTLRTIHLRPKTRLGATSPIGGVCVPGAHKLYVSADGEMSICEKVEGCSKAVIGDVERGIRLDAVRRILDEFGALDWNRCRDCWLVRLCPVCYMHVAHGGSWDLTKRDRACEQYRKYYSFCLSLYCEILEKDERALDHLETEEDRPSP